MQDSRPDGRADDLFLVRGAGPRPEHLATGALRHIPVDRPRCGRPEGGTPRWRSHAPLRGALRGDQRRQAQHGAGPQGAGRSGPCPGARRRGRRGGGGVPARRHGPARTGRRRRARVQPGRRLLLHLRLRPARRTGGVARPRRQLSGLGRGTDPRGRGGRHATAPGGRPGGRCDRRLRHLRRPPRTGPHRNRRLPRRRHDRRLVHLDGTEQPLERAGQVRGTRTCPATDSSTPPTADRSRWAW